MFLGGMYPRGGISYSLLMENRNFETFFFCHFVSFGENRFVSQLSIVRQTVISGIS